MARIKLIYDKETRTFRDSRDEEKEEKPKAPFVHEDTIPDTESYATDEGKVFDSKQKLFEHYRANGYECTGGDHLTGKEVKVEKKVHECEAERNRKAEWGMLPVKPQIKAAVAEAYRKAKWGMAPLTEKEKERCLEEEREYQKYTRMKKV